VGILEDDVLRLVDELGLLLGVAAPEDEHDRVGLVVDLPDDGVGELLPALVLVGIGGVGLHGEHGVDHEHALLGPGDEIPVIGDLAAHLVAQFLVHVEERGRRLDAGLDGEAQAVGLVVVVVGVLAEQEHVDLVVRGVFEGREDLVLGGEHLVLGPLAGDELHQLGEVGFLELGGQDGLPRRRQRGARKAHVHSTPILGQIS
jgi:hypothetical protein